jgi:hypothetical protein
MQSRISKLLRLIAEQRDFINRCGGSLSGYIKRYGDEGIPPCDEDGNSVIINVRPCDIHLFDGHEPVPGVVNAFYARHYGDGGSAIFKADNDRLKQLEFEYAVLTGIAGAAQ